MTHPYRTPPNRPAPELGDEPCRDDGELVIALLMLLLGAVRVIPAIASGETFGTEPTLALLMLVVGLVLLGQRK